MLKFAVRIVEMRYYQMEPFYLNPIIYNVIYFQIWKIWKNNKSFEIETLNRVKY